MKQIYSHALGAFAALAMSGAASAESLTIYSPQNLDESQWIAAQAGAAGHDVKILTIGGGELFDRVLAERANPQADVLFGLVDVSMALLKKEGLFQVYSPSWAAELPDQYKDKEGIVHKYGRTPIVLAYDTSVYDAETAPKSWLDLSKDEYKGKFDVGGTSTQTVRTYLAGILARFLDENGEVTPEGWDFLRKFYENGLYVSDADSQLEAFKTGGATINLNWFGGLIKLETLLGKDFEIVETEGGTPVISEGIAIMAGTDQLDEARAFVDWFGSAEFMSAYAEKFGRVPVLPSALAMSPEKVQEDAEVGTPQPIDWDVIGPKLDGWLQKIELEIRS